MAAPILGSATPMTKEGALAAEPPLALAAGAAGAFASRKVRRSSETTPSLTSLMFCSAEKRKAQRGLEEHELQLRGGAEGEEGSAGGAGPVGAGSAGGRARGRARGPGGAAAGGGEEGKGV